MTILIVCEGEKTEPNYFKSFQLRASVKVIYEGAAGNTISLIRKAEEVVRELDLNIPPMGEMSSDEALEKSLDPNVPEIYDAVWCVFDRDSFPSGNFNAAIQMAHDKGYYCAYSNEAFEIWYLLHYEYHVTGYSRDVYKKMLNERLPQNYKKNDLYMYSILKNKQDTAIKNAERLVLEYGQDHNAERDNPSTTVHKLVIFLNRLLRD